MVALSGDYDFQFMIEELAVGAQFKLPYIHVLVNNSYLGLIRQAQRGFDMDYCVQLAFDNINAPELEGYGVDHVAVVEGLGCKAIRVFDPNEIGAALAKARELMQQHQVPVVVEVILERVTNISMGTEINAINEFEELAEKAPTRRPPSRCSTDRRPFPEARTVRAAPRPRRKASRTFDRTIGARHAPFLRQPVHAVHRGGFPRTLRRRRQGRLRRRRVPLPL